MAADSNQTNMNIDNDSDFGLPEVTIEPIDRAGSPRKATGSRAGNRNQVESKKSNTPLIIGLFFFLLVGLAALWQFWLRDIMFKDNVTDNTTPVENTIDDTNNIVDDSGVTDTNNLNETSTADDFGDANSNDGGADDSGSSEDEGINDNASVSYSGESGTMEIVTSRTRRTYVIIGSFVDEDLAKDYANKLGKSGTNTKLINPTGTQKFYRLSVADFGTISEAAGSLDALKSEYGNNLWIIKH